MKAMGMATLNQGYHYKTGDRPLEGFTIQRGVGRGAFVEVYYALSDSGREVALKSVLGYEQIELRGVSQCMNLKSPHLVSIFDIRQNEQGQSFVIMEYVAGPSLRDLLNDSPSGLGVQKTAFFLREIGKGLTYLHDRGIVHRDLKPGNIFYEDGYVKIGDYGLSKAIAPSRHSGQTITVGTVHYMAPEIGQGRYDKSIDIYALGVLVFEMLTGHVPFFGTSHGEILMKHLMETPDVSGIEEPFATVIKKAMAKDPNDRYQSVQEMVEAVFGAEHVAQSVSVFRPESLSVVAERVARKVVTTGPGSSADLANDLRVDRPHSERPVDDNSDIWLNFGRKIEEATGFVQGATGRVVSERRRAAEGMHGKQGAADDQPQPWHLIREHPGDPMTRRQRWLLAVATAAVIGLGTAFLNLRDADAVFLAVTLAALGGAAGMTIAYWQVIARQPEISGVARRLILAVPGCLGLYLLVSSALFLGFAPGSRVVGTYAAVGVAFLLVRWDRIMAPNRRERVLLSQVLFAGSVAFAFSIVFQGLPTVAMGMMAGVALVAQIASPYVRSAASATTAEGHGRHRRSWPGRVHSGPPPLPGTAAPAAHSWEPSPAEQHRGQTVARGPHGFEPAGQPPIGIRAVWMCLFIVTMGIGLFCAIAAGFARSFEFVMFVGGAVSCGVAALSSLIQLRSRTFYGWWGSLVRPLLLTVSLGVSILSGIGLSEARTGSDEAFVLAFFTAFPAAVFLGLLFVPKDVFGLSSSRPGPKTHAGADRGPGSELDRSTGILLTCLGFMGIFGVQRFYVGKIGTGLLYFFTGGLFLVGQIYDLIMLLNGEFTDRQGRRLIHNWWSEPAVAGVAQAQGRAPERAVAGGARLEDGPVRQEEARVEEIPGPGPVDQVMQPVHSAEPGSTRGGGARFVREPRRTNLVLSTLAYAVLIVGVLIGGAAVLQVPAFVAIGFPGFADELSRGLDYPAWPLLFTRIGLAVGAIMLVMAAFLMVVARRDAGAAHVARCVLGIIGLFCTASMCRIMLEDIPWLELVMQKRSVEQIETALNRVDASAGFAALILLLISGVLVLWPEHRKTIAVDGSVREGVAA